MGSRFLGGATQPSLVCSLVSGAGGLGAVAASGGSTPTPEVTRVGPTPASQESQDKKGTTAPATLNETDGLRILEGD